MISILCIFLIRTLRPLLGSVTCIYPLSCSRYAIEQLQKKSFIIAVINSIKRVISCNPFTGYFKNN